MTVSECVEATYLRATGKATTLATTSTKYIKILGLLNYFTREWSRERGVNWNSLYNPALSIGTVTATDAFDLDTDTIRKISLREGDVVRIMWSDGVGYTDYDTVAPDALKDYFYGQNKESMSGFYCTRIGSQLVFNHTFTATDPQFGGDIQVPCYVYADDLVNSTDEIQVDDSDWLVVRAAAEYVRNDITRQNQFGNLVGEANEKMQAMKDDNEDQIMTVDRPWRPFAGTNNDSPWI